MTLDEMKEKAIKRAQNDNPDGSNFRLQRVFENIMDGTIVSIAFDTPNKKDDSNHIHFGPNEVRVYRWHSDVIAAVAGARERIFFFRFIELAGVGGVIAFFLILIFSILLCVLAFTPSQVDATVLEVVKLSFTVILGYFFGSQTAGKKAT